MTSCGICCGQGMVSSWANKKCRRRPQTPGAFGFCDDNPCYIYKMHLHTPKRGPSYPAGHATWTAGLPTDRLIARGSSTRTFAVVHQAPPRGNQSPSWLCYISRVRTSATPNPMGTKACRGCHRLLFKLIVLDCFIHSVCCSYSLFVFIHRHLLVICVCWFRIPGGLVWTPCSNLLGNICLPWLYTRVYVCGDLCGMPVLPGSARPRIAMCWCLVTHSDLRVDISRSSLKVYGNA